MQTEQDQEKLAHLWQDPKHWKWRLIYSCPQDPRIVVPERFRWMGYTLNFAHRSALLLAAVIVLVIIVPSLTVLRQGQAQDLPLTIGFSFVFAIALVFIVSRVGRN